MMMKVFSLRARAEELDYSAYNPWMPWHDKATGVVVVAPDEATARETAAATASYPDTWRSPELSTCSEIPLDQIEESLALLWDIHEV